MPAQPLSASGRLYAIAAFVEALTWAGLLIGMWLKYGAQATDVGVWLFGRLHGAAFLFYLVATLIAASRLRWPGWALLLGVLAAIPPLVTLPLEWWLRRKGLLSVAVAR
jgi:integral membrane protein